MRIVILGATGLIGQAVATRLAALGHDVRRLSRATGPDMAKVATPADWLVHLIGVEAVVNCAGVLQDSLRENTRGVHADGAAALFRACA